MGGHFVSGHVDGSGTIKTIEQKGKDTLFEIQPNDLEALKYIVPKGCITLDGISLTVYAVSDSSFTVWLLSLIHI